MYIYTIYDQATGGMTAIDWISSRDDEPTSELKVRAEAALARWKVIHPGAVMKRRLLPSI